MVERMAKKFKFRLDVVERVRRQARDVQRREVAQAVRAVTRVEDHIAALGGQLRQTIAATSTTLETPGLDVALVRMQVFHRGWLHRQVLLTQQTLAERQRELSTQRSKLADATKQLRVIEKLKDKQWRRHTTLVNREEQASSDEISLARYLRTTHAKTHGGAA